MSSFLSMEPGTGSSTEEMKNRNERHDRCRARKDRCDRRRRERPATEANRSSAWRLKPCRAVRQRADGVTPALDPAAPAGRTADANGRGAIRARGTMARPTFSAGHRGIADRWPGHGSTP
jgi:hypothetical protein